jgi:hypothetical protein
MQAIRFKSGVKPPHSERSSSNKSPLPGFVCEPPSAVVVWGEGASHSLLPDFDSIDSSFSLHRFSFFSANSIDFLLAQKNFSASFFSVIDSQLTQRIN